MATNRACDCISVRKDTISFRYGDRTKNGSLQLRRSEMCLGSCRTWRSVQMRARLEPLTIYCFEKSICSAMRRMGSAQHRGHRNCGNWVGRPPLPCDRPCIRTSRLGRPNGQGRQRMGIGARFGRMARVRQIARLRQRSPALIQDCEIESGNGAPVAVERPPSPANPKEYSPR